MRAVSTDLLSDEECDFIINLWDEAKKETGVTEDKSQIRSGDICWLNFEDYQDIVDRIVEVVAQANTQYYKFELEGCRDRFQLSRYQEGDYYDWHVDAGTGETATRKLSFSIQLNDDYEGGVMELPELNAASSKRGSITIFPSDVEHRVREVTKGVRYSLVGWIC